MSSSLIDTAAPTRKQLVSFGLMMGGVLAAVGAVRIWRHGVGEIAVSLLIVAALFALSAVAAPGALSSIYRLWMRLAAVLAWINTRIILFVIFFLVVTPLGLVMRLLRRSPLDTARRDSYWTEPTRSSYGDKHYEKQF